MARWIWRDFRANWLPVTVVAAVMAIGIGVFAGLGSTGSWRRASNDASFAAQEMHDLRVSLAPGSFVESGRLISLAESIADAEEIDSVQERLVVSTQVDASTADETILVGGRIVGLDPSTGPDRLWVDSGEAPSGQDAVLELKFANTFGLSQNGQVQVAGGEVLEYGGLGSIPTDFYVSGDPGDLLGQFNFAVLYTTLERAQQLGGRSGSVNDLVLGIRQGADRSLVEAQLRDAFSGDEGLSATITNRDQDEAFRILYDDIESDQRFWTVLSAIVLLSAALAAFNLVSRLVESQRREFGVGMAIGAPTRLLAIRPFLVGVEIALLGALLGVAVGLGIGAAMRSLLIDFAPLPVWLTRFQPQIYAQAAVLGFVVPIASAALPIWRATRVEPIEAIRTGHLSGKQPPRFLRRVRLPGSSLNQMPLRNILRTPRRTALTALGVAAAIVTLVAVLGMLDSFADTINRADEEVSQSEPDRLSVSFGEFEATDGVLLNHLSNLSGVQQLDPGVRLPATLESASGSTAVLVESIDFAAASWTPSTSRGASPAVNEVLLAEGAADSLGVGVGDTIAVAHPVLLGTGFGTETTQMRVAGTHPNPLQVFAYVNEATASEWGFGNLANQAQVIPASDTSRDSLQATLFGTDGVASAQPASRTREVFEDAIDQFSGFLVIAEVAVVALASLIAFNSARITVEERTREHATMMAFGSPVRSVLATITKEGVLIGLMSTAIGLAGGYLTLSWMISELVTETLPDLSVTVDIRPETMATAAVIGVIAVALTPLLMVRRIRSMDLPKTLRVVE